MASPRPVPVCRLRFAVLAACALGLANCAPPAEDASAAQPAADAAIEPLRLLPCPAVEPAECEADRRLAERDWPKALEGDYQAQRNVSYMFTTRRSWIVTRPVQGCAWRMVIMATRPTDAVFDDAGMYRIQCGALSERDLRQARAVANLIHRRIHGADLPPLPAPTA